MDGIRVRGWEAKPFGFSWEPAGGNPINDTKVVVGAHLENKEIVVHPTSDINKVCLSFHGDEIWVDPWDLMKAMNDALTIGRGYK